FLASDGMVVPSDSVAPGMILTCNLPAGLSLSYANPYGETVSPYGLSASFLQANGYAAPQYPYGYGNINPYGLGSSGFPYGGGQADWNNTWPVRTQPVPGFFY
ncbi:MAG: hypothetical protein ACYCW6_18220, partial [Candidatus Xenobia bacterium]